MADEQNNICISEKQLAVHKATEALSVFFIAPVAIWFGTRKNVPKNVRWMLLIFGASVFVVDGGLLLKWRQKEKERQRGEQS